jgi:hypothetical protein
MIGSKKAIAIVGLFAIVSLVAASASAGLLNTGTPYFDGAETWSGTTSVVDPVVGGSIDWTVYGPGQFPFSGFAPTPGDFTYVYQFHNTGAAAISLYSVAIENSIDDIGTFVDTGNGVTGDQPYDAITDAPPGGDAYWEFNGIVQGDSSCGLIYSSPYAPLDYYSIFINHGEYRIAEPVPSPSANVIPEPATLWLLASGMVAMMAACWFRRR